MEIFIKHYTGSKHCNSFGRTTWRPFTLLKRLPRSMETTRGRWWTLSMLQLMQMIGGGSAYQSQTLHMTLAPSLSLLLMGNALRHQQTTLQTPGSWGFCVNMTYLSFSSTSRQPARNSTAFLHLS